MKFEIIILLVTINSSIAYAQTKTDVTRNEFKSSWIVKARLIPTPLSLSAGLGMESQIRSNLSVQILFNLLGYSVGADASSVTILSLIPEIRYHFNKCSNKSFFVSNFFEFGSLSNSIPSEIDIDNFTYNKGGRFIGSGILIGKNLAIGKRFHLDLYVGPKNRWQNESTFKTENMNLTETNETVSKWGLRVGLNLNYTFESKTANDNNR